jgi:prophage regulatory protein
MKMTRLGHASQKEVDPYLDQQTSLPKILRKKEISEMLGLSLSSIDSRVRAKTFPAPISLGGRSVGFLESDIKAWLDERIAEANQ